MSYAHEITRDTSGNQVGSDGMVSVSLIGNGRMFKRRAIKGAGSAAAQELSWLVTELNGVRVYQNGLNVIVTTEDLYP